MIQRKQTLYLLLAFVATVVCLVLPLGSIELQGMGVEPVLYNMALVEQGNSGASYTFTYAPLAVLLVLAAIAELIAIFLYKNRVRQARLCIWTMVLLFAWQLLFFYFDYFDLNEIGYFSRSITSIFPSVSILLVFLAHRGIRADERLVRSADRIR
ncbi:MAG: DUF4293 domain-containing protein [Prevotella sp.]|nr:DUF4293 domain-containing protein [Prevotella sp.]